MLHASLAPCLHWCWGCVRAGPGGGVLHGLPMRMGLLCWQVVLPEAMRRCLLPSMVQPSMGAMCGMDGMQGLPAVPPVIMLVSGGGAIVEVL